MIFCTVCGKRIPDDVAPLGCPYCCASQTASVYQFQVGDVRHYTWLGLSGQKLDRPGEFKELLKQASERGLKLAIEKDGARFLTTVTVIGEVTETESVSRQGETLVKNSAADFYDRFYALQQEARSYGITSLVGLVDSDKINSSDELLVSWMGGWVTCLGIAKSIAARLADPNWRSEG